MVAKLYSLRVIWTFGIFSTFFLKFTCGLGCINEVCEGNERNAILNANCSVHKHHCGAYGGKRFDHSLFYGVDISCAAKSAILTPFPGNISFFRPRGGQNGSECLDSGLKITGVQQWSGYTAHISYIKPVAFSGFVQAGGLLGYAVNLSCASNAGIVLEPHIVLQVFFQRRPIDPTYRITDCMCTGQICTSNSINSFIDKPFKHKTRYGKGYEFQCENTKRQDEEEERVPDVLSPIEASFLGRFRPWNLTANGSYICENDGVFLVGTGKWTDFVAHIYNVKFVIEPGQKHIQQGTLVAKRLTCPNSKVDSIFVEIRHKGRLVNVTNLISAADCKLPQL